MSVAAAGGALVFDFDGTIIDTETPIYESWKATYERAGIEPVDRAMWCGQIGLADGESLDMAAELARRLGVGEVPGDLVEFRDRVRERMVAELAVRDGVIEWIAAAEAAAVPLAVASSSPTRWVDTRLRQVGLRDRFAVLSCADPGVPGKPDPAVYLKACARLGVDPAESLAIEDSRNGVAAATAAAMACIAAPGPMTAAHDFSAATVRVDSLADLPPADWL